MLCLEILNSRIAPAPQGGEEDEYPFRFGYDPFTGRWTAKDWKPRK
jgi:hypothetical protein